MPKAKGLRVLLSNGEVTGRFGIRTQARSARFKIGRVPLFLPNKTPAITQNRAFVESSSEMSRSERPKIVSSGIFKRCNDISQEAGVNLRSQGWLKMSFICQEIGKLPDIRINSRG